MAYWKAKNGLPGINNKSESPFQKDEFSMDLLKKKKTGFPSETETKKTEVSEDPDYNYVHRYWKKGTSNTVPHSGTGGGAGDLMPGYPRSEKPKKK